MFHPQPVRKLVICRPATLSVIQISRILSEKHAYQVRFSLSGPTNTAGHPLGTVHV
jgi:hypothetical protein